MRFLRLGVVFFAAACAPENSGGKGPKGDGDDTPALTGCDAWENWSCQSSASYCFATCGDGGSDYWMKCYPGTSYACQGTFASGSTCDEATGGEDGDECERCASALSSCGV